MAYDAALKQARDLYATTETAWNDGMAEGIAEGRVEGIANGILVGKKETAKKMKEKGLSDELIMEVTGLSAEQIATL
ncbi:hypothetical protein [Dyadobacter sp. CY343]|uniref:hypothetical protein n=1 Tax=Dyadobacter sp. CY343 TaxID=2907299 RepID=UPI001F476C59|nr:hypothetical protein [Dyadobacter sp. CY343]MCE7060709.1 hypothetical protein [Dyadobacter sp. CY343]